MARPLPIIPTATPGFPSFLTWQPSSGGIISSSIWRDPDIDHAHHETVEKHVVMGRIAAPKHVDPVRLLDQLDKAMAKRSPCQLYAPDLCVAAGFTTRARVDKRRFDLLRSNQAEM